MVSSTPLLLETTHPNGIIQLTLNRPQKLNALNPSLYTLLAASLRRHDKTASTRLIVLTGQGKTFCGGVDIQMSDQAAGRRSIQAARQFIDALLHFSKPVIAAVFGAVTGIGVTMLMHCDIVLAAASTTFQTPFAEVGIVPEFGSSVLFARLGVVGRKLLMEGRVVTVQDMVAMGVVEMGGRGRDDTIEMAVERARTWSEGFDDEQWGGVIEAKRLMRREIVERTEWAMKEEFEGIDRQIESGVTGRLMKRKMDALRARM